MNCETNEEITVAEDELTRTSPEAAENIQEETAVITWKWLFTVGSRGA